MKKTNRRDFLKHALLLSANSAFLLNDHTSKMASFFCAENSPSDCLGRVLCDNVPVYSHPNNFSEIIERLSFNQVVEYQASPQLKIKEIEEWVKLKNEGFSQLKFLQPVEYQLNEPVLEIPSSGQLAQVTIPFTQAFVKKKDNLHNITQDQTLFYGSTHWAYSVSQDAEGSFYYLIKEDRWSDAYYVNAEHLHLISPKELEPLSSEIDQNQKVICINLQDQILVAYENEESVFQSAISSGVMIENRDFSTPRGDYFIHYKRASRHMVHTDSLSFYDQDLFGVPWVSYFTNSGIAIHGTYWHNNFGQPNSHGCINLPIHAARWIYLWSQPIVPAQAKTFVSRQGTRVEVR